MASGSTRVDNIILGNCIGKGAFGSVWRGINLDTATTVAVKQINLSDIPSAELDNIMIEIDLLQNLNHPNIVKYYGFKKTEDSLNIILELCENGSLRSLCKNFGKLPEHLGAMYITQVLDGLIYLHDQGVIHRDIKGANILATKDGLVKLADFGVATLSNDAGDMSVAGTPYWMAPEIIELSGATTASDIWSVGCTVIELLDGEPPYHDLPPMGALYRIVQDDHPPIPESFSAIVRDFLMQCFQKDCNLRVSAKKLSKHAWIQMSKQKTAGNQRGREQTMPAFEEAVSVVQQWNEALNEPSIRLNRNPGNLRRSLGDRGGRSWERGTPGLTEIFPSPRSQSRDTPASYSHQERALAPPLPPLQLLNASSMNAVNPNNYEPEVSTDNWDDDFAEISSFQLAALEQRDQEEEITKTIRAIPRQLQARPSVPENDIDEGDFEDNGEELQLRIKVKALEGKKKKKRKKRQTAIESQEGAIKPSGSLASRPRSQVPHVAIDLSRSRSAPGQLAFDHPVMSPISPDELRNYRESEEDTDFSDLFDSVGGNIPNDQDDGLALQSRFSNHSWNIGGDGGSDEEDPFAEVDEGFDENDFEANIARGKHAKACAEIAERFQSLEHQRNPKDLEAACDQLINLLSEYPETRGSKIAGHGAIPLLDLIENCNQQNLVLKLLKVLNLAIRGNIELQESLCLVGAIPVLLRYTSRRYSKEIQMAAAIFIQHICHTNTLTLQMFISCRGLRVLIDFMNGNYSTQKELVWIAINGIHSVFSLQSMTPKNDFCRLLAKQGLLDPLSTSLYNTIRDPQGGPYTEKIVQVMLIFSQGDPAVKELLATRTIVHRMLNSLQSLPVNLCVMMLKCIRNISMSTKALEVLHHASAIHTLVQVLGERTGPFATDICNHILTTMFNLCRISKHRREEAAQAGIVPHLYQIAESTSPLKQLALRILCDMAHAGRVCRNILWNNDCLPFYLRLFKDPYWQVNAMDAVLVWLQDETVDVEQVLLLPSSVNLFVQAFSVAKANSFENILDPLLKILRISPSVGCGMAVPVFFRRLLDRLSHPKAQVRLNLLHILRAILDAHPERSQLVKRYDILDVIAKIAEKDSGVIVKKLARKVLNALQENDSEVVTSSKGDDRHVGKKNGANGYDSFVSRDEFFRLRQPRSMTPDELDERQENSGRGPRPREANMPLQRVLFAGKLLDKGMDPHSDTDELSQNEVDDLDIKTTGIDPGQSAHQRGFGLEGGSKSSLSQETRFHHLKSESANSDEESGTSSEEEHFVTSRAWNPNDNGNDVSDDDPDEAPPTMEHGRADQRGMDDEEDEEVVDSDTVRISRQFGHHKSKSLGEILEEDIERSNRLLEGVHSANLTDSMALRRGLPKISLERLDIERFPAWNKRDLEAEYDNDEDDDSDGGPANMDSRSDQQRVPNITSPRSTNFKAAGSISSGDMTNVLKEFHGSRRRQSISTGHSPTSTSSRRSDNHWVSSGTPLSPTTSNLPPRRLSISTGHSPTSTTSRRSDNHWVSSAGTHSPTTSNLPPRRQSISTGYSPTNTLGRRPENHWASSTGNHSPTTSNVPSRRQSISTGQSPNSSLGRRPENHRVSSAGAHSPTISNLPPRRQSISTGHSPTSTTSRRQENHWISSMGTPHSPTTSNLPPRRQSISTGHSPMGTTSKRPDDSWLPSTGMPISPTISSPTAKLPGRTKQLPPSLSSVAGWNSQAPIAKSAPSPGLVLIARQEYSSTLDFSDDDDDNVGSNGNNNNDDDDDDDDDDNEDESDPPTITTTTTTARNGGKSVLRESHAGGQNHMNNHRDDQDNDLDDNAADWSWNLSKFKSNGGGLSNGFMMDKQEEIDWDLEEIRGGNDTPVATITSISAAVSPTTTTGPPGSTLRRRSSHRKSPE